MRGALADAAFRRRQLLAVQRGDVVEPSCPGRRVVARNQEDRRELTKETLAEPAHDRRVEEDADREEIG